jgi:hypothetical protein
MVSISNIISDLKEGLSVTEISDKRKVDKNDLIRILSLKGTIPEELIPKEVKNVKFVSGQLIND